MKKVIIVIVSVLAGIAALVTGFAIFLGLRFGEEQELGDFGDF